MFRFLRSTTANYKELTILVSNSIGEHVELISLPTKESCFVLPNQHKQLARGLQIIRDLSDIIINLSYDGQNFYQHGNSNIAHFGTSLAYINGAPLVVGGSSPRTNKAEQFDISTDTWVRVDAYFFSDL